MIVLIWEFVLNFWITLLLVYLLNLLDIAFVLSWCYFIEITANLTVMFHFLNIFFIIIYLLELCLLRFNRRIIFSFDNGLFIKFGVLVFERVFVRWSIKSFLPRVFISCRNVVFIVTCCCLGGVVGFINKFIIIFCWLF